MNGQIILQPRWLVETLFAEEFVEGQCLQKWMTTQDDALG